MDRRECLAAIGVAASFVTAGCSTRSERPPEDATSSASETPASTSTAASPRPTATTVTPATSDAADEIRIVVSNGRSVSLSVTLGVRRGEDTVFTETVAVGEGERRTVTPGIDRQGEYALVVALGDGTEYTRPFTVESYDLRMGSNLIVDVDQEVRVLRQE